MFFHDDRLRQWNVSQIASLSPRYEAELKSKTQLVRKILFSNGEEFVADEHTLDELNRVVCSSFAAEPGTQAIAGHDSEGLFLVPVIGRALTFGLGVVPITLDGVNDDSNKNLPIVMPSGRVRVWGRADYASLEEYRIAEAPHAPSATDA